MADTKRLEQPPRPDPKECKEPHDVGKITYDPDNDIWYECMYDKRKNAYTWVITPPPPEKI